MKKNVALISFLFLSLCHTSWGGEPTWKIYVKMLNRMYKGLTPYKMPNPADGPGTIYYVDRNGIEQLYFDQETAFPGLKLQQPVAIPAAYQSKMSNIRFNVGANIADQRILSNDINFMASLAITKDTYVTVSVAKPIVYRAQSGLINSIITELDIRNSIQHDILKKLQRPNIVIISGALHVDSFIYRFHRKSAIDSNLDADLGSKSKGLNITYKKIAESEFTLEANSPMFWAYYAYPLNKVEIEQMYKDKLRIMELEDALGLRLVYLQGELRDLEKTLQEKLNLKSAATSAAEATLLEKEIDILLFRIYEKKEEIDWVQGKPRRPRAEALQKGHRAGSSEIIEQGDRFEIERLKNKEYRLFGKKVLIPSEIKTAK